MNEETFEETTERLRNTVNKRRAPATESDIKAKEQEDERAKERAEKRAKQLKERYSSSPYKKTISLAGEMIKSFIRYERATKKAAKAIESAVTQAMRVGEPVLEAIKAVTDALADTTEGLTEAVRAGAQSLKVRKDLQGAVYLDDLKEVVPNPKIDDEKDEDE